MEMLISVMIIALIVLFMYEAIATSKKSTTVLKHHAEIESNRTALYDLFYRDLMESLWLKQERTSSTRYHVISLQTKNSLYDISYPFVLYFVNSQTYTLTRLESAKKIKLPVPYEDKPYIKADLLKSEVEDFNLYTNGVLQEDNNDTNSSSENISRFLLYINSKNDSPILLELAI